MAKLGGVDGFIVKFIDAKVGLELDGKGTDIVAVGGRGKDVHLVKWRGFRWHGPRVHSQVKYRDNKSMATLAGMAYNRSNIKVEE